ncbi:MAG: DUF2252 domain-containing protein [Gemmatimonadaceae bacterium]
MTVSARIERFNAGRDPELLAVKYKKMRKSPFSFFRGTAHLFWEDLHAAGSALPAAPLVWACGDLHLENFGSFEGDDAVAHFDLNDFDEGALASATWELARFVAGVFVATPSLKMTPAQSDALVERFFDAYQSALRAGKHGSVERDSSDGMVKALLHQVGKRKRALLIDSYTVSKKGKLQLDIESHHMLPATDRQREDATRWIGAFAKSQPDPGFFEIIDVARRVAGLGSLGLERLAILVRGNRNGTPAILDAKQAPPSSLSMFTKQRQPDWSCEPERVVSIQRRMQAATPALTDSVKVGRGGYVLRELQPSADRLSLKDAKAHPHLLGAVIETMGKLTAWAQLRSSGRDGSATLNDLIAFAGSSSWRRPLVDYGRAYSVKAERDYAKFCA